MLSTRTTHSLKPLALAVALAALAVPTAHAKVVPAGQHGPQAVPLITDTLGGNGHPNKPAAQGYRFITDTLGGNGSAARMRSYEPRAYVYGGASPFSWSDAGVGAGVTFAAMLLAVGVATLIMRRGRGRLAGF